VIPVSVSLKAYLAWSGSLDRNVKIWDVDCIVSVHQLSKSVWIAVGDYLGNRIEVKSRTANSAITLWCDAAKYRGN
jgi:hypothetical protein